MLAAAPRLLTRVTMSLLGGSVIAAASIWTMQWLVMRDADGHYTRHERPVMEFVRLQRESETRSKRREKPAEPPPPREPPPATPNLPDLRVAPVNIKAPPIRTPIPDVALNFARPTLGPVSQALVDRPLMVLSRLPPQYPYRAQRRGTEGWVRLSFEVTAEGAVRDVVVVEGSPPGIFDHEAIRAVQRWKFKPRIESGVPVAVRTEQTIDFRLRKKGS
ncbi:MAG: energy transducer TonB [Gammaproteobacteria bacterium]|nr:energy transducer TonB [Gammaproteobacteria bacterium]